MNTVVKAGGLIYWIENLRVLPSSKLYRNPQRWNIEILVNDLRDWIRWAILSKKYVTFEEAYTGSTAFLVSRQRCEYLSAIDQVNRVLY
jgi:hypothetical protein